MYAPWPQEEPKEQKTAEAKTEEQETKGTKAEDKHAEVRLAPSPSLRYSSQHAHELANPVPPPVLQQRLQRKMSQRLLQGTMFTVAATRVETQDTLERKRNPPRCSSDFCRPLPL